MKRCLVIINPTSGQNIVQQKLDIIIGKLVLKNIISKIDIHYTTGENDAYCKIINITDDSYDFLIVVGGDGTINEVISALAAKRSKLPTALLPAGTVNDLGNYLKLPSTVDGFVSMIENFYVINSDVGKFNDKYFINVAAAGMFSDVGHSVSKADKRRLGPLAYYFNGLISLPNQLQTKLKIKITFDKTEVIEEYIHVAVISNTSRVGGFNDLMPQGSISDGYLDVLLIKASHVGDLVNFAKDYMLKKHVKNNNVIYRQAKHINIETNDNNITVDLDGELGGKLPATIEIIPSAIKLICPLQ